MFDDFDYQNPYDYEADLCRVIDETAKALGCKPDNEAILESIDELKAMNFELLAVLKEIKQHADGFMSWYPAPLSEEFLGWIERARSAIAKAESLQGVKP